ncbi:UNVERIFIED_CONTAM: hypothetical protein Slati_1479200 [Sesamum latifolium]|uniref:Uncharacterized protein n=1 Tax=Sesamum latifolium TaxID=2727402 RepID=A0AAW2X654_9LAMI
MIAGGPAGGDSQRARKAQVREAYGTTVRNNGRGTTTPFSSNSTRKNEADQRHHDALVITALLANYEIERVFVDSGSSADILYGEAYDQMQLGDVPLEVVDTSLYGFAGEVVHPRGMISLLLTLGTSPLRKTCLLKFLVVDIPSVYNVILGRPTLNAFRTIISTYHMKIKFPVVGGVGEAQADILQARRCYVEAIKREKKRILEETSSEENSNKRGKDSMPRTEPKEEAPVTVQLMEELLTVELIPGDPGKVTKIGSKMKKDVQEQVISCLLKNKDMFAWTPQDLEGIDPGVITHHLNLDSTIRPVKQKKRYFEPDKDKIIQGEVNKLLTAGHIREIQVPEWLSNVVLVPKPGGKWRMCIDYRDLNKMCSKDYYPLSRIDQLVDSTSRCELLSMMDFAGIPSNNARARRP